MLYQEVVGLYNKFRLMHYRSLFGRVGERDGSLSATEAFSVDAIYLLGEPTIKQFSDYLGISQPNATYKINSLSEKGYILKLPSADDKREFHLKVTDKFLGYQEMRSQFVSEAVCQLEDKYSPQELELFEKMLRDLSGSVSAASPMDP